MTLQVNESKDLARPRKLPCSSCDHETTHKALGCVRRDDIGGWRHEIYEIVQCQGCETISFRKHCWSDLPPCDDEVIEATDKEEFFPPRRQGQKGLKRTDDLPANIRSIYQEVHQAICSTQPILASIGIRALLEAVCSQKKATGKNLSEKIDDLAKTDVLTTEGADILHRVRILGNESAHEVKPPKSNELEAAMAIAEHLLQSVFILPAIARSLKERKKTAAKKPG